MLNFVLIVNNIPTDYICVTEPYHNGVVEFRRLITASNFHGVNWPVTTPSYSFRRRRIFNEQFFDAIAIFCWNIF